MNLQQLHRGNLHNWNFLQEFERMSLWHFFKMQAFQVGMLPGSLKTI